MFDSFEISSTYRLVLIAIATPATATTPSTANTRTPESPVVGPLEDAAGEEVDGVEVDGVEVDGVEVAGSDVVGSDVAGSSAPSLANARVFQVTCHT